MFQDMREWIRTEVKLHRAERDLLCTKLKIDLDKVMQEQAWEELPHKLYQHVIAVSVFVQVANFMDNYPVAIEEGMAAKDISSTIARNFFEVLMTSEKNEKYAMSPNSLISNSEIDQARMLMRQWFAKHATITKDGKVTAIRKG